MNRDDDEDRAPAWRRYLRFWRSNPAGDVRDELEFHLQSTIDELVASGMTPQAARDAARKKLGDLKRIAETLDTLSQQRERTMARAEWWDTIKGDVVFGLRQLRRTPAFTIVAVLTLALGIGATTAIFSVVYSVLLKPLPFADADRVVVLNQKDGANDLCCVPYGNFVAWKTEATGFDAMGAVTGGGNLTLTGVGDPTPITSQVTSSGYWKTLAIPPVIGRYFSPDEDRESAPHVAILSHGLWQNRFSGDRAILGKSITLDGAAYAVIGVAPPDYILTGAPERIWTPLAIPAERVRDFGDHELRVFAHVKPGVPTAVAVRQLTMIETRIAKQNPHSGYDGGIGAPTLVEYYTGPHRETLYMLLGAVALVLLIACGNIASLLLARANVRRGEIAIRGALGATRGRIVAQLLIESVLLAIGGGIAGVGVAAAAMRFLISSPVAMPRLKTASLSLPVLLFTAALAIACAVVFGLVPALRAARLDLQQTLRDGGRESRGAGRDALRRALVVGELCVAMVLLTGAGLLIRSSLAILSVPAGFDTNNLLSINVSLPEARYANSARVDATFQSMEDAIAAIPGVKSVGRTQVAPIHGGGWDWTAFREGSDGHDSAAVDADMRYVSPNYFSALGLPLLQGRPFTRADGHDAPPVAIVSRGLAKRLFGDVNPIGHRIADGSPKNARWREIVGVVADMHASGLTQEVPRELYWSSSQQVNSGQTILIRGNLEVTSLMPAIRKAIAGIDPTLAISGVATMKQDIDRQMADVTFNRWLLTLLGLTGLVLAAVGVYGVIAYVVAQRTHEFGVRMALGSNANDVQRLVLKQALSLAAVGVGLGLVASFLATKLLARMVFSVSAHDPVTFAVVAVVLTLVAVGASYIPARRATRIDPLEALRGA